MRNNKSLKKKILFMVDNQHSLHTSRGQVKSQVSFISPIISLVLVYYYEEIIKVKQLINAIAYWELVTLLEDKSMTLILMSIPVGRQTQH